MRGDALRKSSESAPYAVHLVQAKFGETPVCARDPHHAAGPRTPFPGPRPAYIPFSTAIGFLTLPTERTFRTGSLNTSIVVGSL